jgi:hypothetical protein
MIRRTPRLIWLGVLIFLFADTPSAQQRTLDIYWIDVEGGAATLVVSPSGESLLYDAGWEVDGRDGRRIAAAVKQAGLKQIDYFVLSHFHADHAGGLQELSKLVPIGRCFDRGDFIEPANQKWRDIYLNACASKRTILKAGDTIPLEGVRIDVVASNGDLIAKPLAGGGPNPLCASAENKPAEGPENQFMVGALLTYGKFRFLDLADLDWEKEMELACPINRIGQVTIWQAGRHGALDGAGRARSSPRDQAAGGRRRQRAEERTGRGVDQLAEAFDPPLRANRRDTGNRGHLAGTPLSPREGQGLEYVGGHDRKLRRIGRMQGALDSCLRQTGRNVHDHQRTKQFQQDVRCPLSAVKIRRGQTPSHMFTCEGV